MALSKIDGTNFIEGTVPSTVAPGAGKVLQVVQSVIPSAAQDSTSATYADVSGSEVSLTPSSTSSKILFRFDLSSVRKFSANTYAGFKIFRKIGTGSYSELDLIVGGHLYTGSTAINTGCLVASYLDSPSTTDIVYYKIQFNNTPASGTIRIHPDSTELSTTTLMEVAG